MSIREQDSNLHERVGRLEAQMDWVKAGFDDIRQEMRETRQEIRQLSLRLDSWLKWMLGFTFTSWLTLMASIWLKK